MIQTSLSDPRTFAHRSCVRTLRTRIAVLRELTQMAISTSACRWKLTGFSLRIRRQATKRLTTPMEQGVHVKLSELEPVANVTIKIGPSPAEIVLDVVDRSTGNPVGAFVVRWIRIDDDRPVAATDSIKNRVFVPPNVEQLLTVRSHPVSRLRTLVLHGRFGPIETDLAFSIRRAKNNFCGIGTSEQIGWVRAR